MAEPWTNPGPNATRCPCCGAWTHFHIVRCYAGKASDYAPTIICPLCKGTIKQGAIA